MTHQIPFVSNQLLYMNRNVEEASVFSLDVAQTPLPCPHTIKPSRRMFYCVPICSLHKLQSREKEKEKQLSPVTGRDSIFLFNWTALSTVKNQSALSLYFISPPTLLMCILPEVLDLADIHKWHKKVTSCKKNGCILHNNTLKELSLIDGYKNWTWGPNMKIFQSWLNEMNKNEWLNKYSTN